MSHYGMTIDLDRCVGCRACSVGCTMHNGLPKNVRFSYVNEQESGTFPDVKVDYLPHACMQCVDPICMSVCPTGATYQTEEGVVLIDQEVCIGCESCVTACPYGARKLMVEVEPNHDEGMTAYEETVFSYHKANTTGKCTFCYDRVAQGELPVCVATCPAHARRFGDLDDPESDVAKALADGNAHTIFEGQNMQTSVYYIYEGDLDIDAMLGAGK